MERQTYPFKVSVSIITYNQKDYIAKAIDSALNQEVDFPYEIVIGDDYSTDGTREILVDYQKKYPDMIRLNLHDEHDDGIPGRLNNITNIESAQGKYIAFLDGDDYWISKDKLQKQAAFMDNHPEYTLCFHNTFFEDATDPGTGYLLSDRYFRLRKNTTFDLKDFVRKSMFFASSSSSFFRKEALCPLPDWFWQVYYADYFLQLIATRQGPAKYLKNIRSHQVKNVQSVSKVYDSEKAYADAQKSDRLILKKHFEPLANYIIDYKAEVYFQKFLTAYVEKNYFLMLSNLVKSFKSDFSSAVACIKNKLQIKLWTKYNR